MEDLAQELRDARAREAATSEILRVINRSPDDYRPVFDAILEHATRLCDVSLGLLLLREDQGFRVVADRGVKPKAREALRDALLPIDPELSATAKSAAERRPIETLDAADEHAHGAGLPLRRKLVELEGLRTQLIVPMLRGDEALGVILVYRREVRSFEAHHVELLSTFAAQAAIAVDSVRRFRALGESLERQTATSEILRVISRSPTDYQPVFDTILENATRLCDAPLAILLMRRDDAFHLASQTGPRPEFVKFLLENPIPLDPGTGTSGTARAAAERRPIHVADVTDDPDYRADRLHRTAGADIEGVRSALWVPMVKNDESVGMIILYRREVRPFDESHISLVSTFADQAVIAVDNVRLFQELEMRNKEVTEALEQQTATSNVLQVISNSPTDVQPTFDIIVESASRLCDAEFSAVARMESGELHLVALNNLSPEEASAFQSLFPRPPNRSFAMGRAFLEGQPVHVEDAFEDPEYDPRTLQVLQKVTGYRTILGVPLLRDRTSIGVILCARRGVKPFSEAEIELVKTFAAQAVIAIENQRLFNEVETRNKEISEALEQQTATSEILRVISTSPTDIQPVLDTVVENAARFCGASDAEIFRLESDDLRRVAHHGPIPGPEGRRIPVVRESVAGRAITDQQPVHVPDLQAETEEFPIGSALAHEHGYHAAVAVPLLREGSAIGTINLRRAQAEPFTDKQIELLQTFAAQAVIAIENVRLFQELQTRNKEVTEALEQQTATTDVLRVISSSPTDAQPVFDMIAHSARRLCDGEFSAVFRFDGELIHVVTQDGPFEPASLEAYRQSYPIPPSQGHAIGRAILSGTFVQIPDVEEDPAYRASAITSPIAARSIVAVPMMREGRPIGGINVMRREVGDFPEKQLELLRTFADQAVIAIENVRLFQALEARTEELGEALERQTATSDILRTISRSPTDYAPVFDAILDNATRLCDAPLAFLLMREADHFHYVANKGSRQEFVDWVIANPVPMDSDATLVVRAATEGLPQQMADISDTEDYRAGQPHRVASADIEGIRTALFVPMMKAEECVGVIAVYRREVRRFDDSHVALVSTFADQAVIAIDNVRLFQALDERTRELARSVEELRALGEIGQAVNSTLDPETVLTTIMNQAVALTDTDGGVIAEYDEDTGTLPPRAAPGLSDLLEGQNPVKLGEGAMGRAAETRAPVQIPDVDAPGAYTERLRPLMSRAGLRALLAVPLLREDRVLGALLVARKTPGEFPPDTVELLGTFAAQSAIAIQNARLFRELEEKGRELAQANQHKSEFLANMSHELRTPLNAVIGFSEVLGEEMFGDLNDKQKEYVDDIHASGRHLLSLINDILDLSKIEAGRMELDVTTFDVGQAIANALTLVSERAARRGIALESHIGETLSEMSGDERKVKQILLNLLSNAIKFTPEGGRVTLTADATDSSVVIAVRDTGVGISAQDQERIFEEFRQVGADYSRKVEGTGLGLTLTRRFVELHDGEIAVESEPGVGSEFRITLPLEPPQAVVAEAD